jgi:TRAP-type C4-dicarboxylate transport system permease small subunit
VSRLVKLGRAVGGAIDFLSSKVVWLSALSVLAIFVLVVVDVFGRYFFGRPVKGSNDIGEMILVCIAYLAMAYTQKHKEHVRVTLIWGKLPRRGKAVGDALSFLFGAVIVSLITWNLAQRTWRLFAGTYPSSSETAILGIPHTPFLIVAVIGAVIFALALLADSVRAFIELGTKAGDGPTEKSVAGDGPADARPAVESAPES